MEFKIRKAELEDYDVLCRLFAQIDELHLQWYPELFRHPEGPSRTRHEIGEMIMSKYSQIFLAEAELQELGLISFKIENYPDHRIVKKQTFILIDMIVVDKNYRCRGIGKALYNEVVNFAKDKSIDRIELKVYSKNTDGILFYKQLGFTDFWERMQLSISKQEGKNKS
jgi:ribosomal protein S18 acetylase RimI-like enzyme